MSLRQLGDAHSCSDAFDCELDTLQDSFLVLIPLNDFVPNFGKFPFDSDHHRIAYWCFQRILRTVSLESWRERKLRDEGAKGAASLPSLEVSMSRRGAVTRAGVLERLLRNHLTNVSNSRWQSCPHKVL
jgi:hypothetical protein